MARVDTASTPPPQQVKHNVTALHSMIQTRGTGQVTHPNFLDEQLGLAVEAIDYVRGSGNGLLM